MTWERTEDVIDDRRSSLVCVGRQSEVNVNAIRWREVHELRTKGVDKPSLPPTKERESQINQERRCIDGGIDKPRGR